jgi:hypothetical protein
MQFITYWELNENMPEAERQAIAGKLMESGMFPPEGVEIIRWDSTPDLWGVVIFEAVSVEKVVEAIGQWRVAGAGFFKSTKTAPVMPVQEIIPIIGGMMEKLNG